MSAAPAVSVVIPAYNAGRWLAETIGSVLGQSLGDFELIVVDDASTDDTAAVAAGIGDPRLRLIRQPRNMGVSAARNAGIEAAQGEFIAFLDADDIALPQRLEKQVAFLRAHPEVAILGGWMQTFGRRDDVWTAHAHHDDIRAELLYDVGIMQPTAMCRRDALLRHGLRYDPALHLSEDYELWTRCADVLRLANLPEVLVNYRVHGDNCSLAKEERLRAASRMVRLRQLAKLGMSPGAAEADFHARLFQAGPYSPALREFDARQVERWLLRLREANRRSGYVPDETLCIVLYEFWRRCSLPRSWLGSLASLGFLLSPPLAGVPLAQRLRDMIKAPLGLPLYPLRRA